MHRGEIDTILVIFWYFAVFLGPGVDGGRRGEAWVTTATGNQDGRIHYDGNIADTVILSNSLIMQYTFVMHYAL